MRKILEIIFVNNILKIKQSNKEHVFLKINNLNLDFIDEKKEWEKNRMIEYAG
jgi:hypothetical protein